MILPIHLYGSKSLSKKAENVPTSAKLKDEIKQLVRDMHETMMNANGIGLSANQVGSPWNIFVIDANSVMEESSNSENPLTELPSSTYINPTIISADKEKVISVEGCLSFPLNFKVPAERPKSIVIRYFDLDMIEHETIADGIYATVLQHEYDHLQGVTMAQYITGFYAKRLKLELKRFARGQYEFEFSYKTTRKK